MHRRSFIKAGAALAALTDLGVGNAQDVPSHNWDRYDFGSGPQVTDRLNQGPFGIEQDEGWYTVLVTSQSEKPLRNYGLGLVGYTWEESGPSLAARNGTETLEQHVEKLSSLPFVDVLYIRPWPACPSWTCSTSDATGGMCRHVLAGWTSTRYSN